MSMKFCTTEEKPVDIEIVSGGETHHIKFYPTDLLTRERFYQTYENLKNYKLIKHYTNAIGDGVMK